MGMLIEAAMWTVGLWPLSDVLRGRRSGKIRSPVRRNLGYYFRKTTEREKVSTFVFSVKAYTGNACIPTEPIARKVRCCFKKPEICTDSKACLGQPGMEGGGVRKSKENGFWLGRRGEEASWAG